MEEEKFELGEMTMTAGMRDRFATDEAFRKFVTLSVGKYITGDWGDICADDKKRNENALIVGDRVFASYRRPSTGETIWIITESDRSATTILFPEEY